MAGDEIKKGEGDMRSFIEGALMFVCYAALIATILFFGIELVGEDVAEWLPSGREFYFRFR
jgi:hypothetical protein